MQQRPKAGYRLPALDDGGQWMVAEAALTYRTPEAYELRAPGYHIHAVPISTVLTSDAYLTS